MGVVRSVLAVLILCPTILFAQGGVPALENQASLSCEKFVAMLAQRVPNSKIDKSDLKIYADLAKGEFRVPDSGLKRLYWDKVTWPAIFKALRALDQSLSASPGRDSGLTPERVAILTIAKHFS
jgi:hypothetical protein